ncbi:MAG: hypothetical protein K5787_13960 [Lentisphaeria bacterium]|nr:hypothetical protein [Lentisphaeria bacterium]
MSEKEQSVSSVQEQVEAELSKAFHLLCDAFPEPMALCHRTHRVVAVNPAAEAYGRVVGMNCARNCASLKAGLCRQAQMMKKGKATWCHLPAAEGRPEITSYWIPVTGHPDYYFHFGVGVTIDYAERSTEE